MSLLIALRDILWASIRCSFDFKKITQLISCGECDCHGDQEQ